MDSVYTLKFSRAPVHSDDVLRQNPKDFPITSRNKLARKAILCNFELDQEQCAKLGKFQTLRITDELRDMMIDRLRNRKEFRDYKQFFRYKNYLVCRLEAADNRDAEYGFPHKEKKHMKYQHGDLRIMFEVVPCAKVSLCGQQYQRKDKLFGIRKWQPDSLDHKSPSEQEADFYTFNMGTEESSATGDEIVPDVKALHVKTTKSTKVKKRARPLCRRLDP